MANIPLESTLGLPLAQRGHKHIRTLDVLTFELADHPYFTRSKSLALPRRNWAIHGRKITMTNPTTSDPIGPGHIMVPNDSLETFEDRTTIKHDEHIARLTQVIEDLRSKPTQVRDLTNLSITLQSPLPEPRNTAPNPPRFPSLDSPFLNTFPHNNLHLPTITFLQLLP
ncbi:hypothetical protein KY285_023219 [Solanum tuberosum]|nr:hypothetical protein KY285_023219 [Solanum tuberosum]